MQTQLEKIYEVYQKYGKICIDSRRVQPDSIFFAIKGDTFDGNKYAKDALANGSKIAVVDDASLSGIENVIYVDNAIEMLQKLAQLHRNKLNIPIIGITGTNGKTTTKELLATVLAKKYRVSYTSGNKNNHIGVPLTLLSMNSTVDIGIVEMGANHIGEIGDLCNVAQPNYGIITNIGIAHIEGFGSLKGVIKAKSELYDYLFKNDGTVFCNKDNVILADLVAGKNNIITYGNSNNVFCKGDYSEHSFYAAVNWSTNNESGCAKSNLVGDYNFENILAAITVGNHFKIPSSAIDNAISSYLPNNNRSQFVSGNRNRIIFDLYNANPTSMYAAINNFIKIGNGSKCLILGDMLELGESAYDEHKKLLDFIADNDFKKVYLVGKNFMQFSDYYEFDFFEDSAQLAKHLIKNPDVGKFYLVKGSRGIRLEKCTDYL